jgi:hypothetical protein
MQTNTHTHYLLGLSHLLLGELNLEVHSGVSVVLAIALDEGLLLATLSVDCA